MSVEPFWNEQRMKLHGRAQSKRDARIMRGAEILKSQLQPSTPPSSRRRERAQRAQLHKESERIKDDLMGSSVGSSPNRKSKAAFDEAWNSKHKHVDIRTHDTNEAHRTVESRSSPLPHIQYTSGESTGESVDKPPSEEASNMTPVSYMGRDRKLKTKHHTYLVQNITPESDDDDNDSYSFVKDDYDQYEKSESETEMPNTKAIRGKLWSRSQTPMPKKMSTPIVSDYEDDINDSKYDDDDDDDEPAPPSYLPPAVQSPPTTRQKAVSADPAYDHAMKAGTLWRSIAGQHVKFPPHWGPRRPPLGCSVDNNPVWQYTHRINVHNHKLLERLVRNRASRGKLLLHLVLKDKHHTVVADVAIGAYHPNARGVRSTPAAMKSLNDARTVWMAVRLRQPDAPLVLPEAEKYPCPTKITNHNMRSVLGEQAPLETVVVPLGRVQRRVTQGKVCELLQDFVFS